MLLTSPTNWFIKTTTLMLVPLIFFAFSSHVCHADDTQTARVAQAQEVGPAPLGFEIDYANKAGFDMVMQKNNVHPYNMTSIADNDNAIPPGYTSYMLLPEDIKKVYGNRFLSIAFIFSSDNVLRAIMLETSDTENTVANILSKKYKLVGHLHNNEQNPVFKKHDVIIMIALSDATKTRVMYEAQSMINANQQNQQPATNNQQ